MKKLHIILAALVFFAAGTQAQTWTVDKSHAKLGFQITHLMISDVDGSFKNFEATITSSKEDLSDAIFEVSADIASINTENEGRDKDLRSAGYFDADQFPKLTFKSTSFKKAEGNKFKVVGDLTIKGVTKPVELSLIMNGPIVHPRSKKTMAGFKVSGTFNRVDFGVGKPGGAMVSEEVMVVANGEFVKG
ncbi:MAG: YceI family protein [Cytophagales bacterium]|nr:YceI family protein [Cytophagales bacterium]